MTAAPGPGACSEYLDTVDRVIQETNGVVDKYIGDVAMALWNALSPRPVHAREACIAALVCRKKVGILQRRTSDVACS